MKSCPVCHQPLKETFKHNVLMEVCPHCRGVWLDNSELEKIIFLSHNKVADYEPHFYAYDEPDHYAEANHDQYHHNSHYGHAKKKKGVTSWFEGLFDD